MELDFLYESQINFIIGPNFNKNIYLDFFSNNNGKEYEIEKLVISPEVPGEITVTVTARKEDIDDIIFELQNIDSDFGELDFITELILDDEWIEREFN